jgi:hypothetical protein
VYNPTPTLVNTPVVFEYIIPSNEYVQGGVPPIALATILPNVALQSIYVPFALSDGTGGDATQEPLVVVIV